MPSLKDLKNRIERQIDAEDHQGHANGRRGEAAPRAGSRDELARPYAERMATR
jgi:hypothetical protein